MRNTILLLFLFAAFLLNAQSIPVRTVTVFKNGKAMVERSGKITVENRRYTTRTLPPALFGTYWASSSSGDLMRVFTAADSLETPLMKTMPIDLLEKNKDQPIRIWMSSVANQPLEMQEGRFVRRFPNSAQSRNYDSFLFQTTDGRFLYLQAALINRIEFKNEPTIASAVLKKASSRLELSFNSDKKEQNIDLLYLSDSIGWTPVYRLELTGSTKGRLSLRAEIVNNSEDLGDAELRLAVGIPNFEFADQKSLLFNFPEFQYQSYYRNNGQFLSNSLGGQTLMNEVMIAPHNASAGPDQNSSAEDFFFYSVRPGPFPKFSRFQVPVLEEAVETNHYFDCTLIKATPDMLRNYTAYASYGDQRKPDEAYRVDHFVEFKNKSQQPWTTGVANILSENKNGLQPLSQSLLPYTAPGAQCKVLVAQVPDLKVNHTEAVTERRENQAEFFLKKYDVAKVEGRVKVANYKSEPATIRIHRSIVGKPLSSEQEWKKREENAYLWVNSSFEVEWEITLKPGEERSWKYSYEVLVDW
ncbi:MAG: DUF4139 domain-containing protein [Saprospiraceae bacterium]|nr:DUF4139 domain-containing protein [Saprospiraceae bacterium]